jgi:hypothetical protein
MTVKISYVNYLLKYLKIFYVSIYLNKILNNFNKMQYLWKQMIYFCIFLKCIQLMLYTNYKD